MPAASRQRQTLRALGRAATHGFVTVAIAAKAWRIPTRAASVRLADLARKGWLARAKRGLYLLLPIEAGANPVAEDPWVLADLLFAPCYIGGWSSAEHWGLTEQLYRSTFVLTAAAIRRRDQTVLGAEFHLVRVPKARVESVPRIWHGRAQVRVASQERTLVDALVDPSRVGGTGQLMAMLVAYRESRDASATRLAEELRRSGNGAAHKRAGFLLERLWPEARQVIEQSRARRSAGVVRLDPAMKRRGRMNRRWGLWVNVDVTDSRASA